MYRLLILVTILPLLQNCSPNCIMDIYYAPSSNERYKKAMTTITDSCDYTLNECENDCPTEYINRKHYNSWAKEYQKLNLEPPHHKKFSRQGVIKFKKRY